MKPVKNYLKVLLIDHDDQRYNTLDDYFLGEHGNVEFRISNTGNPVSNRALLIHALVEEGIATQMGVTHEQIDAWDFAHPDSEEPGDDVKCPYAKAHLIAMKMEEDFVIASGMTWYEHDQNLERTLAQWKKTSTENLETK